MELITLEEYKDFKGITTPKEDAKLSIVIASVSSLIQTYVGRDLVNSYDNYITETLNVDYDTNVLYLNHWPVRDVSSVSEINSSIYPYDSTIHYPVDPVTYVIGSDKITKVGGYWSQNPAGIVVTYRAGYPGVSVPADLKLAALTLVDYYANEQYQQNKAMGSSMSVTMNPTKDTDFPKYIQVILDRYR